MELSQLTMFKVVAEQGSIIRASELLHCVPSNITNRIKLLEKELGVALFIRKGRGLVVSPSGRMFLEYANKIISLCEESRRALDPTSLPSGVLKIGAIESSAIGRLPRLLSKYHHHYPAVQMQFSTGVWSRLLNDVLEHALDGAIVSVSVDHPDVNCIEIYREELVLIASPAAGIIQDPRDLRGRDMFMWPVGCPYRKAFESWSGKHGVSTTITSIASYGAILGCVSSGAGISLVPKGVFDKFQSVGGISGHVFSDLLPISNYFIRNKHAGLHRANDKFAELLTEEFETLDR